MGGVLDHRVYRAAFLPALVALFVVAFSLSDPSKPRTTRLPPLAFDAGRAFASLRELARTFPDRRPGSPGDSGLAGRVAAYFESTGFAKASGVQRRRFAAETVDGATELENVVAVRQGLSNHTVVVLAHRDAVRGPAAAELSGTAAVMELARLLADRDLAKTVVLASVSGGSGGFAGAQQLAQTVPGPVDAVFVLGDVAGTTQRRPFVVPWSDGGSQAPYGLERTAQVALRSELDADPGRVRAAVQAIRRALPLTLGEQGIVNAGGLPAVLISNSGERRPAPDEPIRQRRFAGFGRATLRALTATLDAHASGPLWQGDGVVALRRLVPTWAVRLLVLTLLLPALITAFDAYFRVHRRGLPMGAWTLWTLSFALPFGVAWGWTRLLDGVDAVVALRAPVAAGALPITAAGWLSMASVAVVAAGTAFGLRPLLVRRLSLRARPFDVASGAGAAATGLMLSALVLAVWVVNPYAAAVLLPAAHAWLLVSAPERRLPRAVAIAAVTAGLVLPLGIVAYYAHAWGLGVADGLWSAFGLVSGGTLGIAAALTSSLFAAGLCATIAVLRARRRVQASAPEEHVRTRGPRGYAGPGSLGGTESALRR